MSAEAMFDDHWTAGDDGLLHRRGARVLIVAGAPGEERVLLVRGHDADQTTRSWWFTVGGGVGPDEEPLDAALREVTEETGLVLAREDLVGPVFARSALFDFFARSCRQDELLWFARLLRDPEDAAALDTSGWTEIERATVDELRWWSLPDLAAAEAAGVEVYPAGLAGLVEGLLPGWDGVLLDLGRGDG